MIAAIYNHLVPTQQKDNLENYKGMMAIYKTQYGELAFGRAPRNTFEVDYMYLRYKPALVVDLTEFPERNNHYNYRDHLQKEKMKGFDINMKHFPLVKGDDLQTNRAKSFCELINLMAGIHKQGKKIYIHCDDGSERSAMVMGCLILNLHRLTPFDDLIAILNTVHSKRTDYDVKKVLQNEKHLNLLRNYHEYQAKQLKEQNNKKELKNNKIKKQGDEIKNKELYRNECLNKCIPKKYILKRSGFDTSGTKIYSIRIKIVS